MSKRLSDNKIFQICILIFCLLGTIKIVQYERASRVLKEPIKNPKKVYKDKAYESALNEDVTDVVYLIGDAGDPSANLMNFISNQVKADQKNSRVKAFFLGDNIYPKGILPEDHSGYKKSVEALLKQIETVKEVNNGVHFVPGNHDWDESGQDGLNAVLRQQKILNEKLGESSFLPKNGCFGPEFVIINDTTEAMILDSEKIINFSLFGQSGDCKIKSLDELSSSIKEELKIRSNKRIIYLSHHPVASSGFHFRKDQNTPQDFYSTNYQSYIKFLQDTFKENPPLICIGGHDHHLEFLKGDGICKNYLVSGSGSNIRDVFVSEKAIFQTARSGFIKLIFKRDNSISVEFLTDKTKNTNNIVYSSKLPE